MRGRGVNEAADISEAFKPYYETTIAEPTDPNLLYNAQTEVMSAGLLDEAEMTEYVTAFLANPAPGQHAALYKHVDPACDGFAELLANDPNTAETFRSALRDFTRRYAFLAQVVPFHDPDLERLYLYGKALLTRHVAEGFTVRASVRRTHLSTRSSISSTSASAAS
jgi:type I restriction enzyme R subunit